jgi:hypothetical protein
VIEQETGFLKTFERRLGDEALLMQSTKKSSTDRDFVRRVIRGTLIEVLRSSVPRILTDDEAPQRRRKPAPLDFQPIPFVFRRAAARRHSAAAVQYV